MTKKISYIEKLGWDAAFAKAFEPYRAKEFVPARVLSEHKATYLVSAEDHDYTARVSGRFRYEAGGREGYPVPGDWVAIKPIVEIKQAILQGVLPRRSKISRKIPLKETREQVLAANVDEVFIVQALDQTFNLRSIERYLVVAKECGLDPVVILNKTDLCEKVQARIKEAKAVAPGIPVHAVCSLNQKGYRALTKHFKKGKTAALVGSSGVGKSTIVNNLLGDDLQAVEDVREKDSKGRHVTTSRELYLLSSGALVLDSPGMRELQMWGGQEGVKDVFPDVEELTGQCRFNDCRHEAEPGCAVLAALAEGNLSEERYLSYIKLKKELAFLDARKDVKVRLERKQKAKRANQDFQRRQDFDDRQGEQNDVSG